MKYYLLGFAISSSLVATAWTVWYFGEHIAAVLRQVPDVSPAVLCSAVFVGWVTLMIGTILNDCK